MNVVSERSYNLRKNNWRQFRTALVRVIQVRTMALYCLIERWEIKNFSWYLKDFFFFFGLALGLSVPSSSLPTAWEFFCNDISLLQLFQLQPWNILLVQPGQFHAELGTGYSWPVCFLAYTKGIITRVLRSSPASPLKCTKDGSSWHGDASFRRGWVPSQESKIQTVSSSCTVGSCITVTLL